MTKAYSYLRFSTPSQAEGDSERRQIDASRKYAAASGLDLDETLRFADLGVSAYKGANVHDGALGAFQRAVDEGTVAPGSYLLVENLDRLSRDRVMTALNRLSALLERGVNVVTLTDGHIYTKDTLNSDITSLMLALLTMHRAHDESKLKGTRVHAAWDALRADARKNGTVITSRCPGWLTPRPDRSGFDVVEHKAAVVRHIYEMCDSGLGSSAIATRLNREGVEPFGRGKRGWSPSGVTRVLSSTAPIGTFTPHLAKVDDTGKRTLVPEGEPMVGYFPAVVDEAFYLRVSEARRKRHLGHGGKRGKRFSNLFTGMLRCGVCGKTMRFANKGRSYGGVLVCSDAMFGKGCLYHSWRYGPFERYVLIGLRDVRYVDVASAFVRREKRHGGTGALLSISLR